MPIDSLLSAGLAVQLALLLLGFALYPALSLGIFYGASLSCFLAGARRHRAYPSIILFALGLTALDFFAKSPPRALLASVYWIALAASLQVFFWLPQKEREGLRDRLYLVALGAAGYALLQRFFLFPRLSSLPLRTSGPFLHPNLLAAFLLALFLFGLSSKKPLWAQGFLLVAALFSFSYSAFLVFFIFFSLFLTKNQAQKGAGLGALCLGVFFLLLLLVSTGQLQLLAENLFSGHKLSSFQGRLAIWRSSLAMFASHPLTGFGLGHFGDYFPRYQQSIFFSRTPHSFLLALLTEGGLLGTVWVLGALLSLAFFWEWDSFLLPPLFLLFHGLVDMPLEVPGFTLLLCCLPSYRWRKREGDRRSTLLFSLLLFLFTPPAASYLSYGLGKTAWAARAFPRFAGYDFALYQNCLQKKERGCGGYLDRAFFKEPENWLYLYHEALYDWRVRLLGRRALKRANSLVKLAPYNLAAWQLVFDLKASRGDFSPALAQKLQKLKQAFARAHLPLPSSSPPPVAF